MKLTKEELDAITLEFSHYKNKRAVSIEALKIIQKNRGWVPDNAISLIANVLCISESDLEGVATFYNQIFRQPVGKHIVRYCDSIVCYILGCEKIKSALECSLNIKIGDTTKDEKFTLLPTCCLGMCNKAPIIMIDEDTHFYVNSEKVNQLLELY